MFGLGIAGRIKRWWLTRLLPKTPYARFEVQGHDMVVKMQRNMIQSMYYRGVYEPETTEYMRQNIKAGDVVVDVGANVGYFTLIMARLVGPKGVVYAFEPSDELRKILRRNVVSNGYKDRVNIIPFAVTDFIGTAKFFVNRGHGQSSLQPRKGTIDIVEVQTTTLDTILACLAGVRLVKIDVEGSEIDVIRGLRQTMKRLPNMDVVFEFLPSHTGFSWLELEKAMRGYVLSGLDHNMIARSDRQ